MANSSHPRLWSPCQVDADIFAVRANIDSSCIACALSNGLVSLHSYATGRLSYTMNHSNGEFPVTALRFNVKTPKTFIATSSDGRIRGWSSHKGALLWTLEETDNQIFALDVNPDGRRFATTGLDKRVRIYDETENQVIAVLGNTNEYEFDEKAGHTNRVFSLLFRDENTLFSAGWDDTIRLWDLRTGTNVQTMFGAKVCADALDFHGHWLVSGSWRTSNQLQLWDLRNFTESRSIRWEGKKQCLVYATKFHPSGEYFAVSGSGVDEIRFFSMKTFSAIGSPFEFDSTVFTLSFTENGKSMIVGTQKGLHGFKL